ncbi:MAG: hypothetical protein IH969_09530 [Candidatus Krumholzibacteriota bacterium]|nr:hypothetical protein [Candidatus Krumholzibacteriota bacterium]
MGTLCDELADAAGRDPKSIKLMACNLSADRDLIDRYEEAGADRVTVSMPPDVGGEGLSELDRIAEKVLR